MPANIRLGRKCMEVAYYDTATIMAVKSFIVQAPGVSTINLFKVVSNFVPL